MRSRDRSRPAPCQGRAVIPQAAAARVCVSILRIETNRRVIVDHRLLEIFSLPPDVPPAGVSSSVIRIDAHGCLEVDDRLGMVALPQPGEAARVVVIGVIGLEPNQRG